MKPKNYFPIGVGIISVILIVIAVSAIGNPSTDNEIVENDLIENNVELKSETDVVSVQVTVDDDGQKNYVVRFKIFEMGFFTSDSI